MGTIQEVARHPKGRSVAERSSMYAGLDVAVGLPPNATALGRQEPARAPFGRGGEGIPKGRDPLAQRSENGGAAALGKDYEICVTPVSLEEKFAAKRNEKFSLQSVSRKALPKERVAFCLRRKVERKSEVRVLRHDATGKCFYGGLAVCGSVWTCPVCASRISEMRRKELTTAMEKHTAAGDKVAMLTLTFSHKMNDVLKDSLEKLTKALKRFRSGKRYQRIRKMLGLVGTIRAFEITYGSNGFHPHYHLLLFYTNEVDLEALKKELFELWKNACQANELKTHKTYGLDLKDGQKTADYVSKWGLDQEMTKSHSKKGKEGGLTPFDFLRMYEKTRDKKYLKLFAEFAAATKGKAQLQWSKGLKKLFGIGEKSDEELAAEEQEETVEELGSLEDVIWEWIVGHERRGQFLRLVEIHSDIDVAVEILLEDYQFEDG